MRMYFAVLPSVGLLVMLVACSYKFTLTSSVEQVAVGVTQLY